MPSEDIRFEAPGAALVGSLARPAGPARVPGLVVCHGFPNAPGGADAVGATYPLLAEQLSELAGWAVLTFNFRGTGRSTGDFSFGGWLADIDAAVTHLEVRADIAGVWLVGAATGGALTVCHAAGDARVRGVATLGAPATLRNWVDNAPQFLAHARRLGVITSPGFPNDLSAWTREIAELDPVAAAAKIPPRAFLVLHGAADDVVPPGASNAYAEAAGPETEHRILAGAGHRLRHDPRVVALLAGWLSRQE